MPTYTPHELREIAVRARVDPRTVKAYLLQSKRQHPAIQEAIQRALDAHGGPDNDDHEPNAG